MRLIERVEAIGFIRTIASLRERVGVRYPPEKPFADTVPQENLSTLRIADTLIQITPRAIGSNEPIKVFIVARHFNLCIRRQFLLQFYDVVTCLTRVQCRVTNGRREQPGLRALVVNAVGELEL